MQAVLDVQPVFLLLNKATVVNFDHVTDATTAIHARTAHCNFK